MLTPYIPPGQTSEEDFRIQRRWIKNAIENFETRVPLDASPSEASEFSDSLNVAAQSLLMAGDYDRLVAFREQYDKAPSPELADPLSWAYIMQGNMLSDQARTKTGEEADRLFAQAGEKYQAALKIKPDDHEALYNWGTALSDQAKMKTGEEANRFFNHAREKLFRAEDIMPGHGAYNLACLCALLGDETGCREWLEKGQQLGTLPDREHLMNDSDLESVREREWFKMFFS